MNTLTNPPSPRELSMLMLDTSKELDKAQAELVRLAGEAARTENEYRKAKANAYLAQEVGTVAAKEARVDKVCERERYAAHLAENLHKAAKEAVWNRRSQLSALQSVAQAVKAEAELLTYSGGAA